MADTLSPEERSALMSRIRSADTKPEWILRSALHRLGFRYTLRNKGLPGRPDIVLPKHRVAIFVHGCFWHRHPGCKLASSPKSNKRFWREKFDRNTTRDAKSAIALAERGWTVLVVWECQLLRETLETIDKIVAVLAEDSPTPNGYPTREEPLDRKQLLAVAEERVQYRLRKTVGKSDKILASETGE